MTHQLTPTLIAVEVPEDAIESVTYGYAAMRLNDADIIGYKPVGTVTTDTIDFDCEPYVPNHGMLNSKYAFRSLLESKGLTEFKKLVILEKL